MIRNSYFLSATSLSKPGVSILTLFLLAVFLINLANPAFARETAADNGSAKSLTISLKSSKSVLEPCASTSIEVIVTNNSEVPVGFMKPDCYKGDEFVVTFESGEGLAKSESAAFRKVEIAEGMSSHTVKEGVFTGSVELIAPGKSLIFSVSVFLSNKKQLLVENHGAFGSTGYFSGNKGYVSAIPARYVGCGRLFELETIGKCRIATTTTPRNMTKQYGMQRTVAMKTSPNSG